MSLARPTRGPGFHVPALLLFLVLTFLLLHPVVDAARAGGVAGWEGDNLFYVRHFWWMKHALLDLHVAPFVDLTAYYPDGQDLSRGEMSAANTLLALPLTVLAGPVLAYNVMVLFSFVATGFATYLWVERLTGRRSSGLLAGVIVAFLPYRFAHLPGHLPQLTTQWIPLTLYACERLLERRSLLRAALLGIGVALVALGCWYYGYSLAVLLPLYVLVRTSRHAGLWREAAWWRALVVSGLVAFVLVLPFLLPMLRLSASGALHRSMAEMQTWALNPYDFLLPSVKHPLWGDAAAELFPWQRARWVERAHGLGYVALAAAVVGGLGWRRREPALVAALATVWLASWAIALGPFLVFGNELVSVPVPAAVAQAVADRLPESERSPAALDSLATRGLPIPLPSAVLFHVVPFTRSLRVMARFSFWTALMTAALAGFGLIALVSAAERRWGRAAARALPAVLIGIVAFESASRISTLALAPRAVDRWLAGLPADVVIVELPIQRADQPLQNYWATQNARKNLLGWGASFPDEARRPRVRALARFPAAPAIEFLKQSAVSYVLVTPDRLHDWATLEPVLAREPALALLDTQDGVRIYRVVR